MTDLIAMRDRPPRFAGGDNWARRLCIGLLIDWLDSRPEHANRDIPALRKKGERGDEVALAAAGLTNRLGRALYAGELMFDSRTDHGLEYPAHSGVWYHAHIVGHMRDEELPLADEVYRRLVVVAPDCLSGLVNVAELNRRRGNETDALVSLRQALERCVSSSTYRYDVPDANWEVAIRCAVARLERNVGEAHALLEVAQPERLPALVDLLRGYASRNEAAVNAHRAFSVASAAQQIVLHAAMRLLAISPTPPPAAHVQSEALAAVEELVQKAWPAH